MKFARKTDIIIIIVIAAAGLLFWILYSNVFGKAGTYAEIYYQSVLVQTVDLSIGKEDIFSIEQVPAVVFHLYADGSIAFTESDCPDKICIKSGHLHLAGQYAACLPNQIYMKIISTDRGKTDTPDMIIG